MADFFKLSSFQCPNCGVAIPTKSNECFSEHSISFIGSTEFRREGSEDKLSDELENLLKEWAIKYKDKFKF